VLSSKCRQKNFRKEWQKKYQNREIAPISLPQFHQWQVRERTGLAPKALKGTLHQEPRLKSEDLFSEILNPFLEKCLSFQKILGHFRAKKKTNFVTWSPLGLNHPCLLTSTSAAKNYDGW